MTRPIPHAARLVLAAATAAVLLAGCGDAHSTKTPSLQTERAFSPGGEPLNRATVTRELTNGFRDALNRLAIMDQQSDDAAGLGQDLPTGEVRDAHCATVAKARWRCSVAWRAVDGRASTVGYAVRVERGTCYVAVATPQLPEHYDASLRTFSEHPFNVLGSARRGC